MRFTYAASYTLLEHLQRLLARVAVVRFLFVAHPGLAGVRGPALDALAVEVFHAAARGLDHHPSFNEGLAVILEPVPTSATELAPLVALLRENG
jgi:hypothetical protein